MFVQTQFQAETFAFVPALVLLLLLVLAALGVLADAAFA
jgi:hypothetical protein